MSFAERGATLSGESLKILHTLRSNLLRDFLSYFDVSEEEVLAAEPFRNALDESALGRPGTAVSSVPRYFYVATLDEVISTNDLDSYVQPQCAAGADITYVRETLADHTTLVITGAAKAFSYLEDRRVHR